MVNVFGDVTGRGGKPGPRGERGPRGDKGRQGSIGARGPTGADGRGGIDDMCRWLPARFILDQFRKTEKACFLVRDEKRDLKHDVTKGYIAWLSRADSGLDAIAIHPSQHILHVSEHRDALVFDNSLYSVNYCTLTPAEAPDTYVSLCITFRVTGGDADQWLVSDWEQPQNDNFRGVSASSKEIRVWGVANGEKSYMPIEYTPKRNAWTTVFIEWSNIDGNLGRFVINDNEIHGVFTCKSPGWLEPVILSIGARRDGSHDLKGAISALEVYTHTAVGDKKEQGLPNALRTLIIKDQMMIGVEPMMTDNNDVSLPLLVENEPMEIDSVVVSEPMEIEEE